MSASERALESHIDLPPLPDHFAVVSCSSGRSWPSLSGDLNVLKPVRRRAGGVGALGEAALCTGCADDLVGDRRSAAAQFATAVADASFSQPATRALALTCEAQLRDALGDREAALDLLREAALVTEVRRNAVPFLGWSRHGTPMESLMVLLQRSHRRHGCASWPRPQTGHPDIVSVFAPTTATPRERRSTPEPGGPPALSPREREVLNELARGVDVRRHRGEPVRLREHDQDARVEPLREARRRPAQRGARRGPQPPPDLASGKSSSTSWTTTQIARPTSVVIRAASPTSATTPSKTMRGAARPQGRCPLVRATNRHPAASSSSRVPRRAPWKRESSAPPPAASPVTVPSDPTRDPTRGFSAPGSRPRPATARPRW